jgi:hypothetical protein
MRAPNYKSKRWYAEKAAREAEAARPKSNTSWSKPRTNIIAGLNCLRGALAHGNNAKLEKHWNQTCDYPIKLNPDAPYKEQVVKVFKKTVWVVVLYYNHKKYRVPFFVHVLNVLAYPLKFVPERSVLKMPEYTNYTYRIGDVTHGIAIEFQIPKKFAFYKA